MARRFASSTEQEIEKLLKQKDSENKRRLTKIAKELFHEYLNYIRKKAFRTQKTRRTQMLKLFAVSLFTCKTLYNKTSIRFGFCDIRNNQGLGNCYQPQPEASALTFTSTLIIPDIAKTSSNNCL